MKRTFILYMYVENPAFSFLQILSSRYQVRLCHIVEEKNWEKEDWDLVIFQDDVYGILSRQELHELRKFPWLFVSTRPDIRGYMAPMANLFGVVNLSGINLSLWGIPEELQFRLDYPVEKVADWYFYERQPEICRIAYCPAGNNVQENDFKLISFIQKTNAFLTIVSDRYWGVADAFLPFVRVVPEKDCFVVFKKSHLVVASGRDAVRALAVCKPCVVLGECGLGGLVTPANYEQLRSVSFSGRKGGCPGEFVPMDLLETEIRNVFSSDCKEAMLALRKKVLAMYGRACFSASLASEVERITALSAQLKSRKRRFELKPFQSSVFRVEELDGKMLDIASFFKAEWFIFIDADERFDDRFVDLREVMKRDDVDTVGVWIANLWDSMETYRVDMEDTHPLSQNGLWFRWRMFRNKGRIYASKILFLHIGYLDRIKRFEKYAFYCEEDYCKIEPYDYILDSGVCLNELSKLNGI